MITLDEILDLKVRLGELRDEEYEQNEIVLDYKEKIDEAKNILDNIQNEIEDLEDQLEELPTD